MRTFGGFPTIITLLLFQIHKSVGTDTVGNCKLEINTVKVYPKLKFQGKSTSCFWIWDENMELKYWENLISWNERPLKVIVVPFSHNDAGWLQTFEEYYDSKTKYILNNIVNILPELEGMSFVWSEICFLQRWWDRAPETSKKVFKDLIRQGKLEIVTGGWVMPDEATTHIFSLHNQLVEGHQWLLENLDVTVENAWSIDPFGCSSVMAYLLAASGVKSLVIQRVHYSWKEYISVNGYSDLIWEQDFDGPSLKLRVQQTSGYTVTDSCGPATPLCSEFDFNTKSAGYVTYLNVHKKAELLLGQYGRMGSLTQNNVALVTLGGDFRFDNESEWLEQYRNYKALFDYINGNKNIYRANLRFGTLKTFFKQVYQHNITLKGDFFPYADLYADNTLAYWTGFYSTRPYWKKLSRNLESTLRNTEILYTLTLNILRQQDVYNKCEMSKMTNQFRKIVRARRAVALFQHHDGITGTAKANVMKDFKEKLIRSLSELKFVQKLCIEIFSNRNASVVNESQNDTNEKLVVFNSLPYYKVEVITIVTDYPKLLVTDSKGVEISHQIKYLHRNSLTRENIDRGTIGYELVFIVTLPPLTMSPFKIQGIDAEFNISNYINYETAGNNVDGLAVINTKQKVTFGENGLVKGIIKEFGYVNLCTNLKAYTSDEGSSGAYLFKPLQDQINLYSHVHGGNVIFSDGSIYKEVTVVYGEDYVVSTRVYGNSSYFDEIIEMKITYNISECNTELFVEFVTDLKGTRFYTDVNSFQMRERIRQINQPIESNYYPMTSVVFLETEEYKFAVLSDHSHGVASLTDGSVEIMLDRRITSDDKRGLEEGVEDKLKTTSTLYVLFLKNTPSSSELLNILCLQLNNPSAFVFVNHTANEDFHFINNPFPHYLYLLNFKTLSRNNFPTRNALLSLHNVGYSSKLESTLYPETNFKDLNIKNIIKTDLCGIKEQEELSELSDIKIKPFNIQSVKVYF